MKPYVLKTVSLLSLLVITGLSMDAYAGGKRPLADISPIAVDSGIVDSGVVVPFIDIDTPSNTHTVHMNLHCDLFNDTLNPQFPLHYRVTVRYDNGTIFAPSSGATGHAYTIQQLRDMCRATISPNPYWSYCQNINAYLPPRTVVSSITVRGTIFPAGARYEYSCQ